MALSLRLFHCGRGASMEQCSICLLIKNPSRATEHARETFEARPAPPKKRERPTKARAPRKKAKVLSVEGATQKKNGKWRSAKFPGREFDDLDAYRAAKKQRYARREEFRAQRLNCRH